MKQHYVYRITNKIKNKHYYGSRTCSILPTDDIGISYFSSSRDDNFIEEQSKNPLNFKYKVIKIFKNRVEALELEIKLHNKFDVGINESFYNRSKQTSIGWDTTGKYPVLYNDKKIMVNVEEYRNNPEMVSLKKGNKISEETKLKMSLSNKGQKRSETTKKNMSLASKGKLKSSIHAENIRRGMLGKNTGKHTEEHNRKIKESCIGINQGPQKIVACPHCRKEGGVSNMKRWHFNNCKEAS